MVKGIDPSMVTTANELPGFRVVRVLGIVRGITVRSRNVIANFGATIQTHLFEFPPQALPRCLDRRLICERPGAP